MHNCRDIIILSAEKIDSALPWLTNIEVVLHLAVCKKCHRYVQQLQYVEKLLAQVDNLQAAEVCLSEDAKKRIAEKIMPITPQQP